MDDIELPEEWDTSTSSETINIDDGLLHKINVHLEFRSKDHL